MNVSNAKEVFIKNLIMINRSLIHSQREKINQRFEALIQIRAHSILQYKWMANNFTHILPIHSIRYVRYVDYALIPMHMFNYYGCYALLLLID